MIDNLPEYIKLKNAYNPAHYPANKKTSAEEWNALWLSVMYQGNHQEDVLASILNITIPENINNINNLINITDSHTSLLAGAVATANEAKATADNAETVALGIDAKATEALANSETAVSTADEAKAIALSVEQAKVFDTFLDMETWLKDEANKGLHTTGLELFIKDDDVPDYWVTAILETPNASGYYYDIEATEATVLSVNNKKGIVVLNTDDISDTEQINKFVTEEEKTAWNNKAGKSDNNEFAGKNTFKDDVQIGTAEADADLNIKGTLNINGDIIQNGSSYETHAEQVYTTSDEIILRDGAEVGLAVGEKAGLKFKKYDGTNDGSLKIDKDGIVRVGDVGSEQPLATREEIPTNAGVARWDNSATKFITETPDTTPTASSTKLITSGGIKAYVDEKVPVRFYRNIADISSSITTSMTMVEILNYLPNNSEVVADISFYTNAKPSGTNSCTLIVDWNSGNTNSCMCVDKKNNVLYTGARGITSGGVAYFNGWQRMQENLGECFVGNDTLEDVNKYFKFATLTFPTGYVDYHATISVKEGVEGITNSRTGGIFNLFFRSVNGVISTTNSNITFIANEDGLNASNYIATVDNNIVRFYYKKITQYGNQHFKILQSGVRGSLSNILVVEDNSTAEASAPTATITATSIVDTKAFNRVYKALTELTGITTSSTLAQVCDAMVDNSYLNVSTSGCANLVPTGETDLNGQLEIIKVNANRVRLAWSYQNAARQPIYFATYRNAGGFLGWKRMITDSDEQTITGLKNFDYEKIKISVNNNNNDYRHPLTSPYATTTDKRLLLGVPALQSRYTNYNSNVYMENGKLYSNGKEVATTEDVNNAIQNAIQNSWGGSY